MDNARTIVRPWLAAIAAIGLAVGGCAPLQPTEEPDPEPSRDPRIEQARDAADAGRLRDAIELFEAAATEADGFTAQRYWLRAGLLHARQGNRLRARQALVRTDADPAAADVGALRRLLNARLRLEDDATEALDAVAGGPPEALPQDVQEYWLATQAQALRANDQPLQAARVRHQRQGLLTAGALASANREALWQDLLAIPMPELRNRVPAKPDNFGGWLELAHAVRTNRLSPGDIREAVDAWYGRYPDHPARVTAFAEVATERAIERVAPPERIAVLLPLSGRYGAFGQAVQNGLVTSYYTLGDDEAPELRIYDVGANGRDPEAAYQEAVDRGVDLVIGPLTKPNLEAVMSRDDHPVPVLALNRVDDTGGDRAEGLYQFGLAPEDDAREAARLMQGMGWQNVVALAPDTEWGARVLDAFQAAFEASDGQVLESARYRNDAQDFSGPIRAVLNLDDSEARYQRLRRVLRRSLTFEPRRRHDVDGVFLAAFPNQARLIKPQIRFHRGIGLPTVATSHAYGGFPSREDNQDLDDLMIVDTPWTLQAPLPPDLSRVQEAATNAWPGQARNQPRLLALGADAFRLAGPLDVLADEPTLDIPGLTGRLGVTADQVVHRQLPAGRFQEGFVTPVVPPFRSDEAAMGPDRAP
jgi:outer membrane PBP1 activator LpoA protein